MERRKFDTKIEIKENGKPTVKLTRKCSGILGRMKHIKDNFIIYESKVGSKSLAQDRSFTLVIRNDGVDGEYKMGQLSFLKEEDLVHLRDSIDLMLKLDNSTLLKHFNEKEYRQYGN